jgi:cyclomaltodextrinase
MDYANRFDIELQGVFETREKDWRNGAVVYQVLVDRFAPSADLAAKRHLYPAPKTLHAGTKHPPRAATCPSTSCGATRSPSGAATWPARRASWTYVQRLGADVLYLNPICLAYTNHKYDALDYLQVSPEYGTRDDVKALADDVHGRGMKLVLDGVFNHMGRNSALFQQAQATREQPLSRLVRLW